MPLIYCFIHEPQVFVIMHLTWSRGGAPPPAWILQRWFIGPRVGASMVWLIFARIKHMKILWFINHQYLSDWLLPQFWHFSVYWKWFLNSLTSILKMMWNVMVSSSRRILLKCLFSCFMHFGCECKVNSWAMLTL